MTYHLWLCLRKATNLSKKSFEPHSACGERKPFRRKALNPTLPAERGGFEPPKRFRRLHAFQACLFSHSSISPWRFRGAKVIFLFRIRAFLRTFFHFL